MRFAGKDPKRLEGEFELLHPDLKLALEDFEEWCGNEGLPEPTITCLLRTPEENKAAKGVATSYHLCHCAADIRSRGLNAAQKAAAFSWLRARCPSGAWGLLLHDVGSGEHLHLERKDPSWRLTYVTSGVA